MSGGRAAVGGGGGGGLSGDGDGSRWAAADGASVEVTQHAGSNFCTRELSPSIPPTSPSPDSPTVAADGRTSSQMIDMMTMRAG